MMILRWLAVGGTTTTTALMMILLFSHDDSAFAFTTTSRCGCHRSISTSMANLEYDFASTFRSSTWRSGQGTVVLRSSSSADDNHQSIEAINSLRDFHVGQWRGQAVSFAVTNDVAAGVVRRNASRLYTTTVELLNNNYDQKQQPEFRWRETIVYDDDNNNSGTTAEKLEIRRSATTASFRDCQMDVDVVDASYSSDHHHQSHDDDTDDDTDDHHTNLVVTMLPPETMTGVDAEKIGWCIEHCLVTGDDRRVRSYVVYNDEDDQGQKQLARIVICQEERIDRSPTIAATAARPSSSNDTTSTTMISSTTDPAKALVLAPANLLELASGVWLGDVVVRDNLSVPMSPIIMMMMNEKKKKKKGFGSETQTRSVEPPPSSSPIPPSFASWSVGVQKIAWRWLWDFDEDIRQVVNVGKVLGCQLLATEQFNTAGAVIAMEAAASSSRRRVRRIAMANNDDDNNDRAKPPPPMTFVDWGEKDAVGFLIGSVALQVPRQAKFDHSRRLRPFFTDFRVFQSTADGAEKICSQLIRLYGYDGRLKQGGSAFYTHQDTEESSSKKEEEEDDNDDGLAAAANGTFQ